LEFQTTLFPHSLVKLPIDPFMLVQIISILLIANGAMAMLIAIRRAQAISRSLRQEVSNQKWQLIIGLMMFFLVGYCLAIILVAGQQWQWLTLLTGAVFSLGACFVLFSLAVTRSTLNQLLATRISQKQYQIAQAETQQALQDLQKTQAELIQSEKMAGLGQMVAGVAHEINNPTTFAYSNLQHVEQYFNDLIEIIGLYETHYPQPAADLRKLITAKDLDYLKSDFPKLHASMENGLTRIIEIVQSLKTFARLDESVIKPIDLCEGIESTLMIMRHRLQATDQSPEISVMRNCAALPLVNCQAAAIQQCLMHLCQNAIDTLRHHNHPAPKIWIQTAQLDSATVSIQIRDNSSGITPEIQPRIFDPFFTTKAIGQGRGLGLTVCYQTIVEQHQGKLVCDSVPGQGTTFTITLPIQFSPSSK
jgi:two-component system, NtrC family, sensor kinase